MSEKLRAWILEDNAADAQRIEAELRQTGLDFSSRVFSSKAELLKAFEGEPPALVLADCAVPGFDCLEALALFRRRHPDPPFIFLSGSNCQENAIELIQQGATDLVPKARLEKLGSAVRRALDETASRAEQRRAELLRHNSEARFRALFEGAGAGIALEDLQGKIIETNRALQQMLGYGAAELQQITRKDFTHSQDLKEETAHFKRLLEGKSDHYRVEKRFVRRDGRIFWGRLTVSIVRDTSAAPQFTVAMIEDITERQRAEEAHQQYSAIVESSNDAIISTTLDGIIFSWNPAATRLFGHTASEAGGRPISLIVPTEQEEESARVLERIKQGDCVENFETIRLRKDAELIHVSVTTSPIRDISGKTTGASSIYRDITERKHAEAALRDSEENYRRLVEMSPDAIFIHCDGRYAYLNQAAVELFGAEKPEHMIGKSILDHIQPRFHNITLERNHQLSAGRHEVPLLEQKIIRLDGSVVDVEATAIAFIYWGKPAIQVVARDITERKCAEAALRKSEAENQKLAAFAQLNPNPVLELAADGAVNYSNDAAQQMARSLGKQHLSEFLPSETTDLVKECLAGAPVLRRETVIQNRTISWSFYPVPAVGVVHCYAGDVTDRQNLEAQLRQAQKMESVGQLAGGVAHDFNNILTVISGHTSLLAMSGLNEEALDSARQIGLAADRAANLTRQLLTFSRRQIIQPKNLDLNDVVSNMTKMLHRLLGEDISLQVNYAPNLPLIHADPGMMEQILLNLSVNARDAMPKGGGLFVDTGAVKLDPAAACKIPGASPGEYVRLTVRDTGKGIPSEILPHIFEPFFTTKDVGKGTGLGLATVYGIVQQHRGWITAASKVGQETVFEVFLPAIAAPGAVRETARPEQEIRGGHETILVVEDETPLRILVRSVLQRYGYRVLEAKSGVDALPVWLEHKGEISLLLTDMVMPHGVSGRELAQRLHGDKPELKVIYSSGYSLAVVSEDMVLREGLNFLQKPYNPRKLAQAVRDCLDA